MNERWNEDLLSQLDSQFEILADHTLGVIATGFTSSSKYIQQNSNALQTSAVDSDHGTHGTATVNQSADMVPTAEMIGAVDTLGMDASMYFDAGLTENWQGSDLFHELLGIDGAQSFLDVFGREADIGDHGQRMFLC
jgi:hypothetical protein